jgi:hypothetical protein
MIKNYAGSFVRRRLTAVLAVALSASLLGTGAQAGSVTGTIALSQQSNMDIMPTTDVTALGQTFMNLAFVTGATSGDFVKLPGSGVAAGTDLLSSSLTTPPPTISSAYSFGDSPVPNAFGEFNSISITETVGFRSALFVITGVFTPGSDFASLGVSPTDAIFLLSLTQAGGLNTPISASGTLAMNGVPEPTSMALLGIGITSFIAFRRRFSKSKKLPVS